MIRLTRQDFESRDRLRQMAAVCCITPERFIEEFSHVVDPHKPED
jgi:hypothetical protein